MNLTRFWPVLAALFVALVVGPPALAADPIPSHKLNQKITALAAVGPDGQPVSLLPTNDTKAVVVVFLSFDCPVSNSYAAPLTEMAKTYAARGVKVYGVLPGEDSAKRAAEFKIGFPVYADPKLTAADALQAVTTPEAFVLDGTGTVRYRGRIDDGYTARLKRAAAVTSFDLKNAVEAVVDGKPVPAPATLAIGCPVFRKDTVPAPKNATVTYHKDVRPILQAHCQGCHRPGQVGPFSLTNYKQAVNWADDIKQYTQDRSMPPWKPSGGPGYRNERALTEKDIATLAAWADGGTPEGNPADAPPAVEYAEGWELGPPDLVLTVPEEFHVGATGRDLFRCFVIPTGLTEDKYIVGYEVKPGNPRVLHHTLNFWDRTGKGRELEEATKKKANPDAADHGPGYTSSMGIGFIPTPMNDRPGVNPIGAVGGWAPGQRATKYPEGSGLFLPMKSDFILQAHYHRTGKPETDRIQVGLYFAKKPVEKRFQTIATSGMPPLASIPAGKADYKTSGSFWLTTDAMVHNVMPHMHLLGKKVKITMTPPTGETVSLVDIPQWDYNWQETYWFKKPIHVKAGTRFDIEGVFDNSSANPNNPFSPPLRVYFGEETTNEMLFGFIGVTPIDTPRVLISRLSPDVIKTIEKLKPKKPDEEKEKEKGAKPAAPNGGAQRFDVPFRLTDTKHVLVRAKLNGKGPFNFILDTGAPAVFLSKKIADQVGLKIGDDGWADFKRFELEGGLVVDKAKGRPEDLFQLEGMNGMGLAGAELHGVIGYTILSRYRITYDFTADKLAWVPLDFDPPPVQRIGKGEGGQGPLEAIGPAMKVIAGLMGINPNFEVRPRGRLGVEVEDRADGVYVTAVLNGSPAAKAGLKAGDRLTNVNKEVVATTAKLHTALNKVMAGTPVSLTRARGTDEVTVRVTLDEGL